MQKGKGEPGRGRAEGAARCVPQRRGPRAARAEAGRGQGISREGEDEVRVYSWVAQADPRLL